jgi:copper chaperone CopZ
MNSPTFAQTMIPVIGMSCFSCELSVETSLKNLEGVKSVKASAKSQRAMIQYDPSVVTIQQIVQAISRTGYNAYSPKE